MPKQTSAHVGSNQDPRQGARVSLSAEITLRRSGQSGIRVKIRDVSLHGCKVGHSPPGVKVDQTERPQLDELVWVRIDGLEAMPAVVNWVCGLESGLQFQKPIHPAVFDMLVARLTK